MLHCTIQLLWLCSSTINMQHQWMAEHVTVKMSEWLKHVMLSLDFYTWQTLLLGIIPCVSAESCQTKSIKLHNHRM
jgi:hypothetical protein